MDHNHSVSIFPGCGKSKGKDANAMLSDRQKKDNWHMKIYLNYQP